MCGRFTLTTNGQAIAKAFQLSEVSDLSPRYNIAPSQLVATIVQNSQGQKSFQSMKWGLIPSWAKDPKIGHRLINARAETLQEKPSFRSAFQRRRCLILADGFYEWLKLESSKQPYYIHLQDRQLFAFAGLWEEWQSQQQEVIVSCCIITTEANELIKPLHHRMPVILSSDTYSQWLDPTINVTDQLQGFLTPYNSAQMKTYPVSQNVNRPTYDQPDCLEPIN